ncbi:unnamed protein product, partial [marine sediment metagenome]
MVETEVQHKTRSNTADIPKSQKVILETYKKDAGVYDKDVSSSEAP